MLNLYEKPGYKTKPLERIKWWIRREKFKWQRANGDLVLMMSWTWTTIWQN